MSSLQEKRFYLQLWSFTTGPAIDAMQHYFEVKVLNTSSFEHFLNDANNKHILFHQCFPKTQCCKCAAVSLAAANKKGCLYLSQFDKLYDNSGLPQPSHENMIRNTVIQYCLCKYSAKSSVTVNDLDIILFNDIVQHCCPSKINFAWRTSIKDVRNFLAHIGTGYINKKDFDDRWRILNTATLGFAGEIGKVCERMFQNEIVRIQNCSTDELRGMLEKSTDNQIKMLNLLNGFKPTIDECKESADQLRVKQETHDQQFETIQSVLGQSTQDLKEIKHKMNNFESFMKLLIDQKGKDESDGNRRITVETQVDNSGWNEENTARRLCEMSRAEIDEENDDKERLYITSVENKCIQIELVAFPDVFKNSHSLRKAIKILIFQLVDAGEIDTSIPGRMDILFTVKTPLTKEEIAVLYSVFGSPEALDESTGKRLDLLPKLTDHVSAFKAIPLDANASEYSDSEMDYIPIEVKAEPIFAGYAEMDCMPIEVKAEPISAGFDKFFITVANVQCLLEITGLPENVEDLDGIQKALDNKGNKTYYVELILECPQSWNEHDLVSRMNSNLSKLHGYFHIDFIAQTSDGKIAIQTTVEEKVFLSKNSLESALQQLLSRIRIICNFQSSQYEELSILLAVLSVSDQREFTDLKDEKKTVKEDIQKSSITTDDNNVRCQFCKTEFQCYKCTAKTELIQLLSRANRTKEQTKIKLQKTSMQTEKEITEEPVQKKKKYKTSVYKNAKYTQLKSRCDLMLNMPKEHQDIGSLFHKLVIYCDGKMVNIDSCNRKNICSNSIKSLNDIKSKGQEGIASHLHSLLGNTKKEYEILLIFSTLLKEKQIQPMDWLLSVIEHQHTLACYMLLAYWTGTETKTKDVILPALRMAIAKADHNITHIISWFIIKEYLRYCSFENDCLLDIWPAVVCNHSNCYTSTFCSKTLVIVVETSQEVDKMPHTFWNVEVKYLSQANETKTQKQKSDQSRRNTTPKSYVESSFPEKFEIDGNLASELFKMHSKLTFICKSLYKSKNGVIIEQPCVQLYCRGKGLIPVKENHFPKSINNVETDVLEGESVLASLLRVGDNISTQKLCGTLGGFVKVLGDITFLTCAHLTFSEQDFTIPSNEAIYFDCTPTLPYSTHLPSQFRCGKLRYLEFKTDKPGETSIDAALIELQQGIDIDSDDFIANRNNNKHHFKYLGMGSPFLNENWLDHDKLFYGRPFRQFDNVTVGASSGICVNRRTTIDVSEDQEEGMIVERETDTYASAFERYLELDIFFKFRTTTPVFSNSVHLQETRFRKEHNKHTLRRISRRMYNQIAVTNIQFSLGDSGTCIYVCDNLLKKYGCLGMAIATHPGERGGAILTPMKDILKSFPVKIKE